MDIHVNSDMHAREHGRTRVTERALSESLNCQIFSKETLEMGGGVKDPY